MTRRSSQSGIQSADPDETQFHRLNSAGSRLLEQCLVNSFIIEDDWDQLPPALQRRIRNAKGRENALRHYCECWCNEALRSKDFGGDLNQSFTDSLIVAAPLCDIGMATLPSHILLKPAPFSAEERLLTQTHTTIGAEILQETAAELGDDLGILTLAADIARHHHERFDGAGYPDCLRGEAISLGARITAVCSAYDAMRSARPHRMALPHSSTMQIISEGSPGQFDPDILKILAKCEKEFEQISNRGFLAH
jgi:response regulator RpfG family c-di-GMP phosphodiesterase